MEQRVYVQATGRLDAVVDWKEPGLTPQSIGRGLKYDYMTQEFVPATWGPYRSGLDEMCDIIRWKCKVYTTLNRPNSPDNNPTHAV